MLTSKEPRQSERVSTGIQGLDEITRGGFLPNRTYMLRGGAGTGKTTLGAHFLKQGAIQGEEVLYITLGEPEEQIRTDAGSRGIDLSGVHFLDLSPDQEYFAQRESYDIFSSAEVENDPITQKIVDTVGELQPRRVVVDAMTQLRYLSSDQHQFRKQSLSFFRFLSDNGATVLFLSEDSPDAPDHDLRFMSDGVISLSLKSNGRSISISKFRGSGFKSGVHHMHSGDQGMVVYPILDPGEHCVEFEHEILSSGVPELDKLMHGGVERGAPTIITGPSGVGKTTLGLLFMKEAASRGERSVVYSFEESPDALLNRSEAINIPLRKMMEQGRFALNSIEPLHYSPDEFAWQVREEVEKQGARIVMLDSLSGYQIDLGSDQLLPYIHALSSYLSNMGVTFFLINEVEYITGDFRATEKGLSYLADTIIVLRFLEMYGSMRKAIGVLKKRRSDFEKTLRGFEITPYGVEVSEPLTGMQGILSGVPDTKKE